MKKSFISSALAVLCLIATTSCKDNLSEIGQSVVPSSDQIIIKSNTFEVPIHTAYRDSVYVRTGYPLLGSLTDPSFGSLNAGYLAQFYANKETSLDIYNSSDSLTFGILRTSLIREFEQAEPGQWDPSGWYEKRRHSGTLKDSLVGNRIDSMTIRVYYQSYYGDSLTPMQLSIYGLNSDVNFSELPESEFYSNNDFTSMYSTSNLLGRKGYTAANRELTDSVRGLSDYMNYIEVKLDDKYKEDFLRMALQASMARDLDFPDHKKFTDIFADPSKLRSSWLSGVCVKPTFGDGSLIKVYYTAIYLFYSSFHRYAPDGTLLRNTADDGDSTYQVNHVKYVAVTPDVIQMSGFTFSDDRREERLNSVDSVFVSSPQGYYATVDLPVGKIISQMMNDPQRNDSSYFLNAANFYLKAYQPRGYVLSKTPAPTLMMVQLDSVNTYFEEGLLPNSLTSCYASYSSDSVPNDRYNNPNEGLYYYNFGNISTLILGLAENDGWSRTSCETVDAWEAMLRAKGRLKAGQDIEDYTIRMALLPVDVTTNAQYGTVLSVSNYFLPTAVRLQSGSNPQSIQMFYTLGGPE